MKITYKITIGLRRGNGCCFWAFCCVCVLFFSCTASRPDFDPTLKFAPVKLKEDAMLLRKILEANHPSLYWYTPKDTMDFYFNQTINSITDSLTEPQFRNKIAGVVSKIRCGHTAVYSSNQYARYAFAHKMPRFPLNIKTWGDSMVVLSNDIRDDTVFSRGTVITAINGMGVRAIVDSVFQIISTDGYSDNFKYQLISGYFPTFYSATFGLKDSNVITYINNTGTEVTGTLKNFVPGGDAVKSHIIRKLPFPRLTRKQMRTFRRNNIKSLSFDSANTAVMRINSFLGSGFRPFFRKSFEEMKEKNATNLIIDLRENGGGKIGVSASLTRYLINKKFVMADTVAALHRGLTYAKYIHPAWLYKVAMLFASKKENDGKYHMRYLERHVYHPKTGLHFNGHVYILQGGFTFSAASMFVSHLKGQPNVTVVGEESGGGSYGNSSVLLPSVILPNTGIEIKMPLYRIVNKSSAVKSGRGIMPDVYVPPSAAAIKNGVDIKMQRVKELIEWQKN